MMSEVPEPIVEATIKITNCEVVLQVEVKYVRMSTTGTKIGSLLWIFLAGNITAC